MKEILDAAGVPTARFAAFDALQTEARSPSSRPCPGPR